MKEWALAAAMVGSGCLSIGGVQRAETLGKGHFQIALEGGGLASLDRSPTLQPTVDVAGRYGVHDRIDLGVRIGSTGLELQSKFLLNEPSGSTLVSLAPALPGIFLGGFSYVR